MKDITEAEKKLVQFIREIDRDEIIIIRKTGRQGVLVQNIDAEEHMKLRMIKSSPDYGTDRILEEWTKG